jgi:hypothetical protein
MKALLVSLALALAPVSVLAASPPQLIGDWKGVLDIEGQKLTVVFHVGADRVTADSPDQSAFNLPATAGTNGTALTLEIPSAGANFEGRLSPDGKTLNGVLYQGGGSPTLVLSKVSDTPTLPPPPMATPAELKGEWEGKVQTPNGTVTILYHLTDSPTADIQGGGVTGVPARIAKAGDDWKIDVLGAVFTGKLAADGKSMTGTLSQGGQGGPTTLTRK